MNEITNSMNELNCKIGDYLNTMMYWKGFSTGALLIITIWVFIEIYKYYKKKEK